MKRKALMMLKLLMTMKTIRHGIGGGGCGGEDERKKETVMSKERKKKQKKERKKTVKAQKRIVREKQELIWTQPACPMAKKKKKEHDKACRLQ